VVVVPVGHPAGDALSKDALNHYQGLTGSARRKVWKRVVVPWSPDGPGAELGVAGWQDVLLSPESTADPAFAPIPWWARPETVPGSAALGIAVQAGLIRGIPEAPGDQERPSTSSRVDAVRTFVRRVDASGVEEELRSQVLRTGEVMPAPTRADTGTAVPPYAAPLAQVHDTTLRWRREHEGTVRRTPPNIPATDRDAWGFLASVRLFLEFMLKAALGAPAAWLRSKIHDAKTVVAASTTRVVFGKDSSVDVIVGGVGPDGHMAGWKEIQGAAHGIARDQEGDVPLQGQPSRRDFSALWTQMVGAARGLLDASGSRALGTAPYEGFVPSRDAVAPALDGDGTHEVTEAVGSLASRTPLHAWDALEIARVRGELQRVIDDGGHQSAQATTLLRDLDTWASRNEQRFLPGIGRTLADWFEATRRDASGYLSRLRALLGTDPGPALERAQRRKARWLRVLLVLLVVAVIVLSVLYGKDELALTTFVVALVVAVVVWVVFSFLVFVRGQQDLFHLLHQQSLKEQQIPALQEALRMALEDLDALGSAYAQFDRWAMILTRFLAEPLGREAGAGRAAASTPHTPAGLGLYTVGASPRELEDRAARLRSRHLTVGWLAEAFEAMQERMPEDLTADQRVRIAQPDFSLWAVGGESGSELDRWAEGLARHGVPSGRGDHLWAQCLADLARDPGSAGADAAEIRRQLAQDTDSAAIVDQVLAPGARLHENRAVSPEGRWLREAQDGLSTVHVLVQSTDPLPATRFVHHTPSTAVLPEDLEGRVY
jgi:hypothetical protein